VGSTISYPECCYLIAAFNNAFVVFVLKRKLDFIIRQSHKHRQYKYPTFLTATSTCSNEFDFV